ncbi:hypothetical protein GCM10010492_59410 [Saccharothrix mutabilis subsp. mutabilis]|uniref:Uncharacterized protein n=1 Tax=Saccharothrix mutabilis subsp. mutabilis TaxID=66855 RepID=A0ABP3E6H9_9PSEU
MEADGGARGGATVGVGQVKPLETDITGALRVELEVEPSDCDVELVLLDAVLVPAA